MRKIRIDIFIYAVMITTIAEAEHSQRVLGTLWAALRAVGDPAKRPKVRTGIGGSEVQFEPAPWAIWGPWFFNIYIYIYIHIV